MFRMRSDLNMSLQRLETLSEHVSSKAVAATDHGVQQRRIMGWARRPNLTATGLRNSSAGYAWVEALGLVWRMLTRQTDNHSIASIKFRIFLPILVNKCILEGQVDVRQCLHCLLSFSFSFRPLRLRNVVPDDSAFVRACARGDAPLVKALLWKKEAYPNDVTQDNESALSVSC